MRVRGQMHIKLLLLQWFLSKAANIQHLSSGNAFSDLVLFHIACLHGYLHPQSDPEGTLPFPSAPRKQNSHLPKKGKCLYGSPLHIQPGRQVSVPASRSCGLAGEEPWPWVSLHPSSLFPQPLFPIPCPNRTPHFTPKQRFSWFWQALTRCFASPGPALAPIHFQRKRLDQLVLMGTPPERQAEQVLIVFPQAFIFLALPQSPSPSPAATATAPASETAAAAAFRKRLHQLRLSLLFLMLFVPVNDQRADWSSAAEGCGWVFFFSFFFKTFFSFFVWKLTQSQRLFLPKICRRPLSFKTDL